MGKKIPVNRVSGDPHKFYSIPCEENVSSEKQKRGDVVRHREPTNTDSIDNKNVHAKPVSSQIHFFADSTIDWGKNAMKAKFYTLNFL